MALFGTFRQLEIFALACEQGSVSAAAHLLGISQAAVSRQIKALETTVGQPLFDRSPGRKNRPSAAGRAVLAHALAAVREREKMAELLKTKPGTIRIGADQIILNLIFAPHRHQLEADAAPHRVEWLLAECEATPAETLRERELDMLFFTLGDGEMPPAGAHCVSVSESTLFAAPSLLDGLAADAALPVIVPSHPRRARDALRAIIGRRLKRLHQPGAEAEAGAVLDLIFRGIGAGLINRHRAAPFASAGMVREVGDFEGPVQIERYVLIREGSSRITHSLASKLSEVVKSWLK